MRKIFLAAAMLFLSACTYSQNMMNPEGQVIRCSSYGWGIIGDIMAQSILDDCVASHKELGYVEIEKVGVSGFYLQDGDPPSILKFQPEDGPAARAGMQVGDKIIAVNGKPVSNLKALIINAFGKPGDVVVYDVLRGTQKHTFRVILMPKAPPKL